MKLAAASVTKLVVQVRRLLQLAELDLREQVRRAIAAGEAGLLPSCIFNRDRPRGEPCVLLKWFDRQGNVFVLFSVPAGDPRGKV